MPEQLSEARVPGTVPSTLHRPDGPSAGQVVIRSGATDVGAIRPSPRESGRCISKGNTRFEIKGHLRNEPTKTLVFSLPAHERGPVLGGAGPSPAGKAVFPNEATKFFLLNRIRNRWGQAVTEPAGSDTRNQTRCLHFP